MMPKVNGHDGPSVGTSIPTNSSSNEAPLASNDVDSDFNDLMKEEFSWMDQLRDACLEEDRGTEWKVNLLYGIDIPQDVRDRVMQHTMPTMAVLRAELNQLNAELQSLDDEDAQGSGDHLQTTRDDCNNNDDDSMVTEEDLVTQIDSMIADLKGRNHNLNNAWQKVSVVLDNDDRTGQADSSSCSSKSSLSTTTSSLSSNTTGSSALNQGYHCFRPQDKMLDMGEQLIKCITDTHTVLKKVEEITQGVSKLPLLTDVSLKTPSSGQTSQNGQHKNCYEFK